jgi:hypothetical protein
MKTPKIFISYRRFDAPATVGRIRERLNGEFGPEAVFQDIHQIEYGERFDQKIRDALSTSRVLLAIMGKGWLNSQTDSGERRLELPDDWVRNEIRL